MITFTVIKANKCLLYYMFSFWFNLIWPNLNCRFIFQVVQEYERAVVFRLGRLRSGGAKGPGLFFVMPCVDSYKKVDLRTVSFDVPPQEVMVTKSFEKHSFEFLSNTGWQMDCGPRGFNFRTLYCYPNLFPNRME